MFDSSLVPERQIECLLILYSVFAACNKLLLKAMIVLIAIIQLGG